MLTEARLNSAARRDFSGAGEFVDDGWRDHRNIERLPALDPLLQAAGRVVVHHDLVARLLLEVGRQGQNHLFEGAGCQKFHLGGAR